MESENAALDGVLEPAAAAVGAREPMRTAAESELRFLSFLSHDLGNHLSAVGLNSRKRRSSWLCLYE
jgi:hypothetical protein